MLLDRPDASVAEVMAATGASRSHVYRMKQRLREGSIPDFPTVPGWHGPGLLAYERLVERCETAERQRDQMLRDNAALVERLKSHVLQAAG